MRFIRLLLPVFLLLIGTTSISFGQHIGCDDITRSTTEIMDINNFSSKPGDTAWMPVQLKNDSIVTVFQFLVQYDTTYLRPARIMDTLSTNPLNIDSSFVEFDLVTRLVGGRFPVTIDTSFPGPVVDTSYKFQVNQFGDNRNVLACSFLPVFDDFDSIPGGNDVIFYVKFVVDSAMPDQATANFDFFEQDIFIVDTTVFPPDTTFFDGCNTTQATVTAFDFVNFISDTTFQYDTTITPPDIIVVDTIVVNIDTTWVSSTYQRYPSLIPGIYTADINYTPLDPPEIQGFSGFPATVGPGQAVTFNWAVLNADRIVIYKSVDSVFGTTVLSGTQPLLPPQADGNYSYSLVAIGPGGTRTSTPVTITYDGGGGGGGSAPSIVFSPAGPVFSTEQGQAVTFSVSATDPDGKQVTLTATSMPTNGIFTPNPAVGVPTASGTFTFTPDFNQTGSFGATFQAVDFDGETSVTSASIVVTELQFDRLFSTSTAEEAPAGGLAGAEGVYFPINLVTSQT
ncbi:MAG: hypothetical protein V3T31_10080, partial [candidate division Zixibacteria bacterium]